jgi:hypothetical protein
MMDEKSIRELLEGQLSDVERDIYDRVMPSTLGYDIEVAFPLLSRSGRNMIICAVRKSEDDISNVFDYHSFVALFNWFMLHDSYSNIRQKEIETGNAIPCLANISLEMDTNRWMGGFKWWRGINAMIEYFRKGLRILDTVLVMLDDLIKKHNFVLGNHASCFPGFSAYLRSKIYYEIRVESMISPSDLGIGVRELMDGCLKGEVYITRDEKKISLGVGFRIYDSYWLYELFVRGKTEYLEKYVDAMVVEDDL